MRFLACLWLGLAVSGSVVLARYAYTPSAPGDPALNWPRGAAISRSNQRFTLVLLAHPQCPCTRATLEELSRLLAGVSQRTVDVHVVFLLPDGFPDGWQQSTLWNTANAIPGVTLWTDSGGRQAQLFGAQTSGQVLLYDPSGKLRFSGGITTGRGHAGDNPGLDALDRILFRKTDVLERAPVFGCSLR